MKVSKRVADNDSKVDQTRDYDIKEAISLLKSLKGTKFDEMFEAHINLGIDPKHADQNIRAAVSYPHGTGRKVKILVLTKLKADEAQKAGADFVGLEEYIEKIKKGWTDVDIIVATPDVMGQVGRIGKILGPKGLMPNPKSGTITNDVAKAIKELRAGRVEIRVDKYGIIHSPVGKRSFNDEKIEENVKTLVATLMRMKPAVVKGLYFQRLTLSTTMGPGIQVDKSTVL